MELGYLASTIVKMVALVAWIYGLLWGLGRKKVWQKAATLVLAFAVIQAIIWRSATSPSSRPSTRAFSSRPSP
jgi:hypothetical protein